MAVPAPADGGAPYFPEHVAIIMDGNGRWALSRGLPRASGHPEGAEAVRRTIEASLEFGIRHLTLYGFSMENWSRPRTEVQALMAFLRTNIAEETARLDAHGVRLRFIGDRSRLDRDIAMRLDDAERRTESNARLDVIVALSYGGRQEITSAARRLAGKAARGEIDPAEIDERTVSGHLFTSDVPDPDLVIRTGGERRISNFLLWQVAYSEFVFTDVLWPDFSRGHLAECLDEFGRRNRRYGALSA